MSHELMQRLAGYQDDSLFPPVTIGISQNCWIFLLKSNFLKPDNNLGHWKQLQLFLPDQQFPKLRENYDFFFWIPKFP